jgi:hypothetical protein
MRLIPAIAASLLALAVATKAAWAQPQEPAPPQPSDERPIAAFGDGDPNCLSWTDGCVICARLATGAIACSTPGIACLPAAVQCAKTLAGEPDLHK